MSVDQTLLEQAAIGKTTLRFYQWSKPTLSLGYFQPFQQRVEHQESQTCPWLRRASGGGAILHDLELTYSFATPQAGRPAEQQQQLYDGFHNSLIQALATFDITATRCSTPIPTGTSPFLCFQRQTVGDVLLNDHKVMGSAQRKYQQAILQHGSILLQQSQFAPPIAWNQRTGKVSSSRGANRAVAGNACRAAWPAVTVAAPFKIRASAKPRDRPIEIRHPTLESETLIEQTDWPSQAGGSSNMAPSTNPGH